MRYRIEYVDGRCCNFANSRKYIKVVLPIQFWIVTGVI